MTEFFRSNPGAIFIIAFQVLLVSAAVFLSAGDSKHANDFAVYAFYALVAGIVLQGTKVVTEARKRPTPVNSTSA